MLIVSCSQSKPVANFETGQILKVKMGTVKKVNKFYITRDAAGEGTFAGMASQAATAVTPGFMAEGTSKLASATGSIMDSKVQTIAKIRIRVEMDPDSPPQPPKAQEPPKEEKEKEQLAEATPVPSKPLELVEIIQNDIPGLTFQIGQKVVISTTGTSGNAWPE